MFSKKDGKVKDLEKRIDSLEKQLDGEMRALKDRTKYQIKDLGDSLKVLEDVMKKVQDERNELKKERDFLVSSHKELIRRIPVDKGKLKRSIRERLLMPFHARLKENMDFIKDVAADGLVPEKEENPIKGKKDSYVQSIKSAVAGDEAKTPIDELFELVMNESPIKMQDAARRFGVTEAQLEEWSKILENHGLIEIHYPPIGKPELRKKTQDE